MVPPTGEQCLVPWFQMKDNIRARMLTCLFFFISSVYCTTILPTDEQANVLKESMKHILDYEKMPKPGDALRPLSRVPSSVSRYMKNLYEDWNDYDEFEDGDTVTTILPRLGKANLEETIDFDFSFVPADSKILRVELHFSPGRPKRRRSIKATAICTHPFCSQDYSLTPIRGSRSSVVFDATLSFAQLHSINQTRLAIKLTRRDVRMLPYSDLVRKRPPFLVVFSQSNIEFHSSEVLNSLKEKNRVRPRRAVAAYFTYPMDEKTTVENNEVGFGLTKRKAHKKNRKEDPWYGFGESKSTSTQKTTDGDDWSDSEEEDDMEHDTEFVALDRDRKEKACSRDSFQVEMSTIGWDDYVLAPKQFDLGLCSGACAFPLSPAISSPHSQLHSLLFSTAVSPLCCRPASLRPLILLYIDQHQNLVLKVVEKLLATKCSCA